MPLLIILLSLEVLTFLVIREHFGKRRKAVLIIALIFNTSLSLVLWYLYIRTRLYKGYFDTAQNISMQMNFMGMICGVVIPRFILSLFHYSGKMINLRKGTYSKGLTLTGLTISILILSIVAFGTFYERFNFKTENISVRIKGLKPELEGLRIVQVSDMHLAGFYGHYDKLQEAVKIINDLKPDILINTGDFISYGWREFGSCDTILAKARSRYGNYAIIGNHDFGTYMPGSSLAEKANILSEVSKKISASGYTLLNNSNNIVMVGNSGIELIGVITGGKHRHLVHSDIKNAMAGAGSSDLRILLCHDPNQWAEDVAGKMDIALTLSGHTHGMQMGILTKWFRWSPAKRFYPHWNGLYSKGNQFHYVNRGLGTLAIPFRIWMPPEITLITLRAEPS